MDNIPASSASFARRLFVALGALVAAVTLLYLVWAALDLWMLVFAGVLLAVFLDALAAPLARRMRGRRGLALLLVCGLLVVSLSLAACYLGPKVSEQASLLRTQLPQQLGELQAVLQETEAGQWLLRHQPSADHLLGADSELADRIFGILSTMAGAVGGVLLIIFTGLYLAVDPALYRESLLRLLPLSRRTRFREVASAMRHALAYWLLGRILSMTVVGILTLIGLLILDIPAALTLALLAAACSFIPNIGPILSALPALLVGLMQSPVTAVWVGALYLGVQTVESYLITPFIQQRAVSIPPALLLTVQVLFGMLAGALGLLLATPATVAVVIAIQMLYVQDVLGDDVTVLGE